MATQQNNGQEQDLNHLRKVRREKLAELQANGQNPFEITKYDVTHHSQEVKDNFDELEGKHVVLAGRMMSKRVMGKASFCNIQDLQGNIQIFPVLERNHAIFMVHIHRFSFCFDPRISAATDADHIIFCDQIAHNLRLKFHFLDRFF